MADDLTKTGKQDRAKINLKQKHELITWTRHFNVSSSKLHMAVKMVGPEVDKVREWLAKN